LNVIEDNAISSDEFCLNISLLIILILQEMERFRAHEKEFKKKQFSKKAL